MDPEERFDQTRADMFGLPGAKTGAVAGGENRS